IYVPAASPSPRGGCAAPASNGSARRTPVSPVGDRSCYPRGRAGTPGWRRNREHSPVDSSAVCTMAAQGSRWWHCNRGSASAHEVGSANRGAATVLPVRLRRRSWWFMMAAWGDAGAATAPFLAILPGIDSAATAAA
ncbi:unnamed protein product, partial [Ectocarpus sp. 12 AP-2014]